MGISSISHSVAPSVAPATANKIPASPSQQTSKPVAPAAVKSGADSDGIMTAAAAGSTSRREFNCLYQVPRCMSVC